MCVTTAGDFKLKHMCLLAVATWLWVVVCVVWSHMYWKCKKIYLSHFKLNNTVGHIINTGTTLVQRYAWCHSYHAWSSWSSCVLCHIHTSDHAPLCVHTTTRSWPPLTRCVIGDAVIVHRPATARSQKQTDACWRTHSPALLDRTNVVNARTYKKYPVVLDHALERFEKNKIKINKSSASVNEFKFWKLRTVSKC